MAAKEHWTMQMFRKAFFFVVLPLFIVPLGCRTRTDETDVLLAQGGEAYQKGDFDSVVRMCTEAIRLKPDFAPAYYNRGLAYSRKGDLDKAIADYTEAIRLEPDLAHAYEARANS